MQTNSGFSLIEILIVLVIIGVTLSFALLAFGNFGEKRQIIASAEQFMSYVTLIEQQAILETNHYRIQFQKNNYQVSRYISKNRWENMPQKSMFHPRHFSDATVVRLGSSSKASKNAEIIINSTGEISPFKLYLGSKNEEIAVITGYANGNLILTVEQSP